MRAIGIRLHVDASWETYATASRNPKLSLNGLCFPSMLQAKNPEDYKTCVACLARNPVTNGGTNGRCVTCVNCFTTKDYPACVKVGWTQGTPWWLRSCRFLWWWRLFLNLGPHV